MLRILPVITVIAVCGGNLFASETASTTDHPSQDEIFNTGKVWDVHLTFSPDRWEAMEPKQEQPQSRDRSRGFLVGPEGGRNGIAAAFGWQFPQVRADLQFGPLEFKDVAVRFKGNGTFFSSRESLKRSLKIDFNDFVKGQKLAGMSQINLHNSIREPSHMNEAIAYELYREAGVPAPRTSYARVFVTVPGKHDRHYFGLYNLVEDVGGSFLETNFEPSNGALLKPVTPNLFGFLGEDWSDYNQIYDPKGKLSEGQKKRIIETCKFFSRATDAEFAARVGDHVDLENFARYMAMTVWLSDMDGILGPGQNYYVYLHPTSNKFLFIPWDQDQSFGQFPRGSQEQRERLSIHKPWNGGNEFLEKMFQVEAFKSRYLAALKEVNESIIQNDRIDRRVAQLAERLRGPVGEESVDRLAELDNAAACRMMTTLMTGRGSRMIETKPIRMFVPLRQASIADQLAGRSEGETTDRGSRFGR